MGDEFRAQEHDSDDDSEETDNKVTLISLVEKHRFLYDLAHKDHKDKNKTEKAWKIIATEVGQSDEWCKGRWKHLRQYYGKVKKQRKGRSGQARKGVNWAYFKSMSFLDGLKDTNENTVSNVMVGEMQVDESGGTVEVGGDTTLSPEPSASNEEVSVRVVEVESTPKTREKLPLKKRSYQMVDEVNSKIIDYLNKQLENTKDDGPEENDDISHWARMAAARLRRLPQHISMAVMMKCDQVIYESLNPIPPQQVHYTEPYQYEFGPGADENYGSN